MATPSAAITEWDASGNPIQAGAPAAQRPMEWDADGNPLASSAALHAKAGFQTSQGAPAPAPPGFFQSAEASFLQPIEHPIQTVEGMIAPIRAALPSYGGGGSMGQIPMPNPQVIDTGQAAVQAGKQALQNPMGAAGAIAGQLPYMAAGDWFERGMPVPDVVADAGAAIRERALGDPNAAALRGLRVSPASSKAQQTLDAVEGARPYLQGVNGLSDLQARVPVAKDEIWKPYADALSKIGSRPIKGPDGQMTTVQGLEDRRLELSAQLRTLRQGGPEAVQLAQQKGLTQANLMREDSQIRSILDPQLRQAGVDPQAVRKAFAQVSTVGKRVAGRTTVGEAAQPYTFARMANLQLDNPRSWIGEPVQGVRDWIAGRPYFRGNPTDVNLREAFRSAGPKPDLTVPTRPIAGLLSRAPRDAIVTPAPQDASGAVAYEPPAYSPTTRAQRQGRMLPAQAGPEILPYYPQMGNDEQLAALLHYLRNNPKQLKLAAKGEAIRLPSGQ